MTRDAQYREAQLVALYDRLNGADHDHAFYEQRLVPAPQRVLDLGCGTGLLARRLVRLGHRVTGVDPAAAMIAFGRAQPEGDRILWHHGTIDALPPAACFDAVIMTGHAFQCLTTPEAVAGTMAAVRRHLAPGGRFMFESRNPLVRDWDSWTPDDAATVTDESGTPVRVYTSILAEEEGPRVTFRNHFAFPDGEQWSDSTLLFLSRDEILRHLRDAGFTTFEVYGDWAGSAFTERSPETIVIAG
ncbi:MAG TPA: methyltransferase domain-containing protein [Acidisoma sp.]|uniref:class I SAM-dependent methyltransferase n=1 Tax=Acidisoma sp. TaxID=1872115 RepID=UPI002C9FC32E|nr:methyltransferase domain-containing protein [Acidisoma sp.]HTI02157.1 methyltransferase domain-containing protein [Acidisoma sp.]